MGNLGEQVVTIATAIVGIAILAVLVSKNSNTSNVISAAGAAFSNAIGVAVSPVTGSGGFTGNLTPSFQLPNLSSPFGNLTQYPFQ